MEVWTIRCQRPRGTASMYSFHLHQRAGHFPSVRSTAGQDWGVSVLNPIATAMSILSHRVEGVKSTGAGMVPGVLVGELLRSRVADRSVSGIIVHHMRTEHGLADHALPERGAPRSGTVSAYGLWGEQWQGGCHGKGHTDILQGRIYDDRHRLGTVDRGERSRERGGDGGNDVGEPARGATLLLGQGEVARRRQRVMRRTTSLRVWCWSVPVRCTCPQRHVNDSGD